MVDQSALSAALDDFCATVNDEFSSEDVLRQLAAAAVRVLDVDGAGVMVVQGGDLLRFAFSTGLLHAEVASAERCQDVLREGPCWDSYRSQRVVDSADLTAEGRWPAYQRHAVRAGLRAVTALPLRARARGWGVLNLYRSSPRRLDPQELAAAQTLANLATSYLVVAADRDSARRAQNQLAQHAMHDSLTGLPVRSVFLEQLAHALARLDRHPAHVGVLFLDLDGLKYVNDTYGHAAGDRLIRTSAERVRAALRPSDVVARVGGDEFVVLLEDLDGPADAACIAQRVLAELAAPYRPDGQLVTPSASLGLAVTSDPERTPDALIAHADAAMYRAKRAGRGRYEVFDPAWYAAERARATARQDLSTALRTALREGQLELHYQPIIDLTGSGDVARPGSDPAVPTARGPVYGVEALARWRHPERGLLAAGEFIDLAERSGLMVELGGWVLRTACEQLASWDRLLGSHAPRRVFVNLSVPELVRPGLADHVATCLHDSGVAASRLVLEITESDLFRDPQAVTAAVDLLRALGCELAIDDFGTGYSSLSRLVQVPVSTLKIDKSFTHGLSDSPAIAGVVAAVVLLGHKLQCTVVVEGVEDAPTLDALRALGCTHAQGYHVALPQHPDQLGVLLAAR